MGFEALLSMIDHYVEVKSEPVKTSAVHMSDWDCGLAMEFESSYAEAGLEGTAGPGQNRP